MLLSTQGSSRIGGLRGWHAATDPYT